MIYIGIDVSSKSFVIHAIDGRKKVVFKGDILPEKRSLLKLLKDLGEEPKYVVFEAGNQMKWIGMANRIVMGKYFRIPTTMCNAGWCKGDHGSYSVRIIFSLDTPF